ncbi:hypothetical protein AM493_02800 [Flavobacterium akiainvivens]|uniref:Polyketide cyclase n=1 Tax=Flavobacterium akiainvivens TaxID=1202724 RepID=A0A0N0RQE9_9FLAO|nr:hypothetical protein [Flavobacterium akiainvivens]KOS05080.1 hypothetical protein AM493_02800 [Flavobacterium akiainvivens]SFQ51836.1 hypothetical protein SAMN05444144_106244 [Flavobacterium akiainvivens]
MIAQKHRLPALGILLGIVYGILTRLFMDSNIASITFMVAVPVVVGLIPLFFIHNEQQKSYKSLIFIPWLTILGFFLSLYLLGIEDLICFLILLVPFIVLGTLGAFIYRFVSIHKEKKKGRLLVIGIVPFLLLPLEQVFIAPSQSYTVTSTIIVNALPEEIWHNIVEVPTITNAEYTPGVFNHLGIPRPVNATVTKKAIGGIRTGTFSGGLQFTEKIIDYTQNKRLEVSIAIGHVPKSKKVFEQHVLKGNYFTFENATYTLTPMANGTVKLSLSAGYSLTTNVNFYGKWWADMMIKDFQDRLLEVIAARCETP